MVTVLQIQVMMPCVSAQRHHDQQCTMFILNLPVVTAAVPSDSFLSRRYVGVTSIILVITQEVVFLVLFCFYLLCYLITFDLVKQAEMYER